MDNASIKKLESDLWESADLLRAGSKLTSNQYCISFHFLDKKPEVLKWLDENKQYTDYQIENDFSDVGKDDICIL